MSAYGLVFRESDPSDPIIIGVTAPPVRLITPALEGARYFTKAAGTRMRLRRRPSSGVGGLRRNFELGPLGHNLAVSKGSGAQDGGRSGSSCPTELMASNY